MDTTKTLEELNKLKETFEGLKSEALSEGEALKNAEGAYNSLLNAKSNMLGSMTPLFIVFGIILLVFAAFLVVAILIQSNKADKGLSGAISGGSTDTFLGRNNVNKKNKILLILTIVAIVLFVLSVIAVYVLQYDLSDLELAISSVLDSAMLAQLYPDDPFYFDKMMNDNLVVSISKQISIIESKIDSVLTGIANGTLVTDPQA
ncbi:MAG: preprotein translocase subunit SecG [Clostridia bacterium]|nr:preprotein translocase subunit SecG [Clostridia bacterium]